MIIMHKTPDRLCNAAQILILVLCLLPESAISQVSALESVTAGNADARISYCCERAISTDGRYVLFDSEASNLVVGDTNASRDVFVRDRTTGTTTRVSLNSAGVQGLGNSFAGAITGDGRYVTFYSYAANLVTDDTNNKSDTFVHDRTTGATSRISVSSAMVQGDDHSFDSAISDDGRFVAFSSGASNLVGDDTNGRFDIFVRDRTSGAISRVSVSSSGGQAISGSFYPTISADGRVVAFESTAPNLVIGDTNLVGDVFVHDLTNGQTTRVSVDGSGNQGNGASFVPSLNADGRFVAFESESDNFEKGDDNMSPDVFIHDRTSGATTRLSLSTSGDRGNGASGNPAISASGRFVAFRSSATNLVQPDSNGNSDIFRRDRATDITSIVSVDQFGTQGNALSIGVSISSDGRFTAFGSQSSNWSLSAGSNGPNSDVFVATTDIAPEATASFIVSHLPDPSVVSQEVVVEVMVEGSATVPGDGQVAVLASTGEGCVDSTSISGVGGGALFSCSLIFLNAGQRAVSAEFSGSGAYSNSSAAPANHVVLNEIVFKDGFELP